jgi:hypothetical protein
MNKARQVAQVRDQVVLDDMAARRSEEAEVPALESIEGEAGQPNAA